MTLNKIEFKNRLLEQERFYHIHHPLHVAMNEGALSKAQICGWVKNRSYYQLNIPQKDANILANCSDIQARRLWIQRIIDHDGTADSEGGIEAWIQLGEACGLTREEMFSCKDVLPGVRKAVDSYVEFARNSTWQESACSSLTELFAPAIHEQRLSTWPSNYQWIDQKGLAYFQSRVKLANRDVEHGLQIVLDHFKSETQQKRAIEILQFKLNLLWDIADGIAQHYAPDLATRGLMAFFGLGKPKIAKHHRLQYEKAAKISVLLYPEGLVELSDSAAAILKLCDGMRSPQEIVNALKEEFEEDGIESDVLEFLEDAYDNGWLEDV